MDLKATIQAHMKEAMKAQDPLKVGALRMLLAEIQKRAIEKRSPLDDGEIQKTISSLMKQRNDSIEAFRKGGREDLAEKEQKEVELLKVYLPAQMSESEVEAIVTQAIEETGAKTPADLGKVMKVALAKTAGKADGKIVSELVKKHLSK